MQKRCHPGVVRLSGWGTEGMEVLPAQCPPTEQVTNTSPLPSACFALQQAIISLHKDLGHEDDHINRREHLNLSHSPN